MPELRQPRRDLLPADVRYNTAPPPVSDRHCAREGCGTRLRRTNPGRYCSACEHLPHSILDPGRHDYWLARVKASRIQQGRAVDAEQIATICERYESGEPIDYIAVDLGLKRWFVNRLVRQMSVEPRRR